MSMTIKELSQELGIQYSTFRAILNRYNLYHLFTKPPSKTLRWRYLKVSIEEFKEEFEKAKERYKNRKNEEDLVWTDTQLECYENYFLKGTCNGCPITKLMESECLMMETVLLKLRKVPLPDEVQKIDLDRVGKNEEI